MASLDSITAATLGSSSFRRTHGLKYAYVTGAMYRGIASQALVVRMAKAGLLSYFGAGGLSLDAVTAAIRGIEQELQGRGAYGMNLLSDLENPHAEMETVALYLRHRVQRIEASAFMRMTPALVWYRLAGLRCNADQQLLSEHHILAKVSRPEVATVFLSPPPRDMVQQLLQEGKITEQQAHWSERIPMSNDVCIEADSGGHTDMGIPTVIFPPMLRLRDESMRRYRYESPIHVGLAGGIGSPESAAAAFIMGADFVLTGSINQCTVQGGTSDAVKDLLQQISVNDTAYAPAGDMFEMGAKVQVLKRGVFFPARANKLFELYQQYGGLTEIPANTRKQIEERYFKRSFEQVWSEVAGYLMRSGRHEDVRAAEASPKQKMARVFKWYFAHSTELAFAGEEANRADFQVHTGPALGSFNQWLKGTGLESWRTRHVDEIAERLMTASAEVLQGFYARLRAAVG